MSGSNVNKVFYADNYHPIQAGSIDGTDILPHDNAVYRALLCSSAGLCNSLPSNFSTPTLYLMTFFAVFYSNLLVWSVSGRWPPWRSQGLWWPLLHPLRWSPFTSHYRRHSSQGIFYSFISFSCGLLISDKNWDKLILLRNLGVGLFGWMWEFSGW